MILNCNCLSGPNGNKNAVNFQNQTYGSGNRVHTPTAKEDSFRCTICGHERAKKSESKSEKADKKLAKSKS